MLVALGTTRKEKRHCRWVPTPRVKLGPGPRRLAAGRTAGYAIGEGRTSPWLRAIAGIRGVRIPGLAQARAGSPEPLRGKLCEPTLCLCTTSRSRRRPAWSGLGLGLGFGFRLGFGLGFGFGFGFGVGLGSGLGLGYHTTALEHATLVDATGEDGGERLG